MKSGKSVIRSEAADPSARKIFLIIGDAAEITDTLYPWMRIQEAGYQVVVAAPEVRTYSLVQHQRPEGWDITQETAGYQIESDIAFRKNDPTIFPISPRTDSSISPSSVVVPGGSPKSMSIRSKAVWGE